MVDDGTHKFLLGAYFSYVASGQPLPVGFNPALAVRIQCFANDISCTQGIFKNSSALTNNSSDYQALVFANGDVITVTQTGRMTGGSTGNNAGTTYTGTGQYQINQYYDSSCAPDSIVSQVTFPNFNGQQICTNN